MSAPGRIQSIHGNGVANRDLPIRSVAQSPVGAARTAITAVAGFSLLAALSGAAVAGLANQAKVTIRAVEQAAVDAAVLDGLVPAGRTTGSVGLAMSPVPRADGVHHADGSFTPAGTGGGTRPVAIAMLGDSTAVGYGAITAAELPGVGLARHLASVLGRPVLLRTHGLSGVGAADLARQVRCAADDPPDLVVIVVGANDIRDRVPPGRSAELLGTAVSQLRARDVPVVVGTCPDFGVIETIPQPLRLVLHAWSRMLATLQDRAVGAAGGRSVPLGRLVSPDFAHHPELFAGDRFHPSGAGYAKAVAALLPPALDELRRVARLQNVS